MSCWPDGVVVKFVHSASGLGFAGLDPRRGPTHCSSSQAVAAAHIQKTEEEWHRCQLSVHLPQAKRGRLAIDLSSGPIFLTKKDNNKKRK